MIEGLSHMTFIVRDLDRMETILTRVLNAEKIYDSGDETFSHSRERFFTIAGMWVAIMEGAPLAERSYNHIAFKISDSDFEQKLRDVTSLGLDIRQGRTRIAGEGRSLYFFDDDNHLFELHTGTLSERLQRYQNPDRTSR